MVERMIKDKIISIPYCNKCIDIGETPLWLKGQFTRELEVRPLVDCRVEYLLSEEHYVDQNGNNRFTRFEKGPIIDLTGYSAEQIRPHGCGVSATFMCLSAISEKFSERVASVGQLALEVLELHRNDFVGNGTVIKGTPVFNLRSGWYHDGLIYTAKKFEGIDAYRTEDTSIEAVIGQLQSENQGGKAGAVISVYNKHWRLEGEPESVATHLVAITGYNIEDGCLKSVLVNDSFAHNGQPKLNQWVTVDDRFKDAFTGRAMIFVSE